VLLDLQEYLFDLVLEEFELVVYYIESFAEIWSSQLLLLRSRGRRSVTEQRRADIVYVVPCRPGSEQMVPAAFRTEDERCCALMLCGEIGVWCGRGGLGARP
jgi:hypothetical protein